MDTLDFPASELSALYDLYNATGGTSWRWKPDHERLGYPWNFTVDANPCVDMWQGVNCTNSTSEYHITEIRLTSHNLTGQLSSSLDQLTRLERLDVDVNQLTGTVPVSIGNITAIHTLNMFSNYLTGTIPEFVYDLVTLRFLDLGGNFFNGSISASIGNLTRLESLSLHISALTGTIPETIYALNHLQYLNLGSNFLTGTISNSIGNLQNLTEILFYVNALSGTIPASLGTLVQLRDLDLGANLLHGTMPSSVGNLTYMRQFFLDSNKLTGTVPESLQYLADMRYFYLRYNDFEGALPAFLGQMSLMREIILYKNHFTGSIPAELSNWQRAEYVSFGNNLLTGTLPAFFSSMRELQYLHLDANHLTGTVPPQYGMFPILQELLVYSNRLHGTLPAALSNISTLSVFLVQYNRFTGSLRGVFNASTQTLLSTIKINNNQLTGPLESEIFDLPSVSVLVAGSNCFSGSIPDNVCMCDTLTTLSLDGLSSASTCRRAILPAVSNSYLINNAFSTTLLPCLFNMTSLNTLHLSGIGMSGTLPDTAIAAKMADLTLSHNSLVGSIPVPFQQFDWYVLDLSYNMLGGTLNKGFTQGRYLQGTNATTTGPSGGGGGINIIAGGGSTSATPSGYKFILSLENNRISGRIPSAVQSLVNVSILGSNLFSCNIGSTNLPTHDDGSRNYQCGSDSFNIPYYAWLILVCGVCALIMVAYYCAGRLMRYMNIHDVASNVWLWYAALEINLNLQHSKLQDRLQMLRVVNTLWDLMAHTSMACCVYIVLVLLPVYAVVSVYHGTMVHQYAYAVSAAFLTGTRTMIVEFVFFAGLLALFLTIFIRNLSVYRKREEAILREARIVRQSSNMTVVEDHSFYYRTLRNMCIYALFAVANFSVVVGVNVAYVYAVIYKDSNILLVAQLLLAFFKVLWNGAGCGYLVQCASYYLREDRRLKRKSATETRFIMLQVFITLLNNIAVPCIVVAVVSPSCFSSVFVAAPSVSTPYTYKLCLNLFDGHCVQYETVNSVTTYEPSYAYTYQCSSSIITYYAPAFVYLCIVTTFVAPLLQVAAQQWHKRTIPGTHVHRVLHTMLPRILRPLSTDADAVANLAQYGYTKPFFHVNRLLILLISYFGLLLTFGAVFPPLAVALTVSLLSLIYFNKLKVGRFLCRAVELNQLEYIDLIEAECQRAGAVAVLRRSAWLLVVCCCCFYALFLFDTLGDSVGYYDAYWVLIVVPLLPVFTFLVYKIVLFWQGAADSATGVADLASDAKVEGDVETSEFVNPILKSSSVEMRVLN